MKRDVWLTSALGLALLIGIPVVALTGLLSNVAYDPRLGENILGQGRSLGPFDFYLFHWPTRPVWLYAVTQGIHVSVGLALVPIVLSKLWSALRALVAGPVAGQRVMWLLERTSLALLIVGIAVEFITGLFEIEYFQPFGGVQLIAIHYYVGWVVIVAMALHSTAKLPTMRRALKTRRALAGVTRSSGGLGPAAVDGGVAVVDGGVAVVDGGVAVVDGGVAAGNASPATAAAAVAPGGLVATRRLVLGTAAAGSVILLIQGAAQAVGGPMRRLGVLMPRGSDTGSGPNDFAVNGGAADAGLTAKQLGDSWSMRVALRQTSVHKSLNRAQLLAMPQHTYALPIACREGWSTTQVWTGVRLRDLATLVGASPSSDASISALDGAQVTMAGDQVHDDRSLLALNVNGVPLSRDHGYPARVIVPAAIGVTCLKWVSAMEFSE